MIIIFSVTALSSMLGAIFRALLRERGKKSFVQHIAVGVLIGIALGSFSVLGHTHLFEASLMTQNYFGISTIFFMSGYVLGDLLDTVSFITTLKRKVRELERKGRKIEKAMG